MRERLARHPAATATALYSLVALATTWPLARGIGSDLPWDLGDPVLNAALLERNLQRLLAFLGGSFDALRGFFDARIFHPEPLTLALSEHLAAQTLQALPAYALGANVLLCYNLLFLSSFVLSALGAFLLVRDLTGRTAPALLAGLCYGFAPYRVEQLSHLQVLSSQWMPFALLLLRRHLETGRALPLFLCTLTLIAQSLSCGYYLLFFPPFLAAHALFELRRRGRLREPRAWLRLSLAAALAAAASAPFVLPYLRVRETGTIVRERAEVELFSADVYAYLTAPEGLQLLGDVLRAHPAPEGGLFPGFVPTLLSVTALLLPLRRVGWAGSDSPASPARRLAFALGAAVLCTQALAALVMLGGGGGGASAILPGLKLRSLWRAIALGGAGALVCLVVSPRARALAARGLASTRGFCALALAAAVLLSFGPSIRTLGRPLAEGPYALLYQSLPGFDGLRVPARFAMLAALFLAVLAGFGAAEIQARMRRGGGVLLALAVLFLAESTAAPLVVNDVWSDPALHRPPARLATGADAPPIYRRAAGLPRSAVLIEFPFGSDPYELRYMFHQPLHGLPLVNGFSGARPRSYAERRGPLRDLLAEPERAWRALASTTATHALVHEGAWGIPAKGRRVTRWLEEHGALRLAEEGSDVLFELAR
jgi:hypothetical protein